MHCEYGILWMAVVSNIAINNDISLHAVQYGMLNVSITTRVIKTVDVISIDNLTEIFCNIWILLKGRDDITCIWNGHADQVIV